MSALRDFAEKLIALLPPKLQPMARWRFIKFGLVGASGTVINIAVLAFSQEFLFQHIADSHDRLNYSIALAISIATISNFYWNRRMTWRDRRNAVQQSALVLFAKYVMAAALSITIQFLVTKWLAVYLHYAIANITAIALASAFNFLANDKLTFRRRKNEPPDPSDSPTGQP